MPVSKGHRKSSEANWFSGDTATPAAADAGGNSDRKGLRLRSSGLVAATWKLLRARLLPVLVLMSLQDAAIFALQRLSDLGANHAAVGVLGPAFTPEAIGNMAFATRNPALDTFQSGYVWLRWLFVGTSLPLKLAVQALATAALFTMLSREPKSALGRNPFKHLQSALSQTVDAIRQGSSHWKRVFLASVFMLVRFLPLGVASVLIIPLYWTMPRMVGLQAATTAAFTEGLSGNDAVKRSQQLLRPHAWRLALPFVALTAAPRVALALKSLLLQRVPGRLWSQMPELPLVIIAAGPFIAMLMFRMQEVFPFVAYEAAVVSEHRRAVEQVEVDFGDDEADGLAMDAGEDVLA